MLEDWVLDNVAAIAGVKPVPLELDVLNIDGSKPALPGPPGFDISSLDKSVQVHIHTTTQVKDREGWIIGAG
jgi:hypothetical protein